VPDCLVNKYFGHIVALGNIILLIVWVLVKLNINIGYYLFFCPKCLFLTK